MGAIGTDEWGVKRLHDRIAALEAENERGYRFYSMCQDGHERIGWKPDEWEECPVCRAVQRAEQAEAEVGRLKWMLGHACEFYIEGNYWNADGMEDPIAELERRWAERGTE